MKLVDFFTAEGKKALQQMIFLGKFVCIDKNTVNDDNWKANYGYTKNIPFLFFLNLFKKFFPIPLSFPVVSKSSKIAKNYLAIKKEIHMHMTY